MIDGIKIECNYLPPDKWPLNDLLLFKRPFYERTGEIPQEPRLAVYNGLKFKITPSQSSPELNYYNIEGSLHRFFNAGGSNVNDFTFTDLKTTVNQLQRQFGIIPANTPIRNIEFGINLELPIKADQFLKYLISTPTKRFTDLSIDKIKIGKVCTKHEYQLKIYNKGKQAATGIDNMIRIEIKVKKMRYLQSKCNISFLADLMQPANIEALGCILVENVSGLIMYDNSIKFETLTNREKIQISNFRNPLHWESMNYRQRSKQLIQFKTLLRKHKSNDIHQNFIEMIKSKWQQLSLNFDEPKTITESRPKQAENHPANEPFPALKKGMFSPLEYRVKTTPLDPLKSTIKKDNEKLPGKSKICPICGRDISHQKPNSIYCSESLYKKEGKKCRNRATQIKRTERLRKQRSIEVTNLTKALQKIRGTNKAIVYTTSDKAHHMTRLKTLIKNPPQAKKIIYVFAVGYEFTRQQAKTFINSLSNF